MHRKESTLKTGEQGKENQSLHGVRQINFLLLTSQGRREDWH